MDENNQEMVRRLLTLQFAYLNMYFWMNPGQKAPELHSGGIYVLRRWRGNVTHQEKCFYSRKHKCASIRGKLEHVLLQQPRHSS